MDAGKRVGNRWLHVRHRAKLDFVGDLADPDRVSGGLAQLLQQRHHFAAMVYPAMSLDTRHVPSVKIKAAAY
jgi:hypothetical protein